MLEIKPPVVAKAVVLRRLVKVESGRAWLSVRSLGTSVDRDLSEVRVIIDQPAVDDCVAGDVVAGAANRKRKSVLPRVGDRESHVLGICRPDYEARTPVDDAVKDSASSVIVHIAFTEHLAFQACDGSSCFGRVAPLTELAASCGDDFAGVVTFSTAWSRCVA